MFQDRDGDGARVPMCVHVHMSGHVSVTVTYCDCNEKLRIAVLGLVSPQRIPNP